MPRQTNNMGHFYWTLKQAIKAVCLIVLYIVVEVEIIPLYGGLSYRALEGRTFGRLKKKCLLCRYCGKLVMVLWALKDECV